LLVVSGRSWGLRSLCFHDASTANHSARADGLAFQFAVSPPRACNDTLNTLRDGAPLLPLLVFRLGDLMAVMRPLVFGEESLSS
jgi:hypothetical protein